MVPRNNMNKFVYAVLERVIGAVAIQTTAAFVVAESLRACFGCNERRP